MSNDEKINWIIINEQQPDFVMANYFAALVGFNLVVGGQLKEINLRQSHYTIGLAYVSGIFAIGRHLEEQLFFPFFLNDKIIFDSLKHYMEVSSDSEYKGKNLIFDDEQELARFLFYAEAKTKEIFIQYKRMLLG